MQAKINNRICEVELLSKEENKVEVSIDGKIYEIDAVMAENGFCSILYQGHSYNAEAIKSNDGKQYTITTNFQHFEIELSSPQKKYLRNKKKEKSSEHQEVITSPMPGKVIDILVSEGDVLKKGKGAIVVEAMKMQNTFVVSRNCRVKKIEVSVGDSVNRDQVLITLE
jgi:biotin carboxyl carrier protein